MKKTIVVVIVCAVTLLFASMAFAQEKPVVNVGLKGWYNSWESGGIESDGSVLMAGPSISVKLSKWFAGISYLTTLADYEFSNMIFVGDKLATNRNDLDLVAGYMFHPRVGVVGGYKHISGDFEYSFGGVVVPVGDIEFSISGPVLGVTANYPIENTPVALFGSLTYLFGEAELTAGGVSATEDITGTTFDLGASYAISEKVSANVGYKHQSFEGDEGGGEDIFSGLTFGLNYAF